MTPFSKTIAALALTTTLATALTTPAFADDAPTLVIENFIGTVTVTTDASATKISATGDASLLAADGLTLMIDGDQSFKKMNCREKNGKVMISTQGSYMKSKNYKPVSDYPRVDVIVPEGTRLETHTVALFGTVGDLGSADIDIGSCSDLTIGNVSGPVRLSVGGSSDLIIGDVGDLTGGVGGSADASVGNARSANVSLGGSSDLELGTVSGDVKLTQGGSSEAEVDAVMGALDLTLGGSAELAIDQVESPRAKIVTGGSSDVAIGTGTIARLDITSGGSSDVTINATVSDGSATAGGSSDVIIAKVTGSLKKTEGGSGDVTVR